MNTQILHKMTSAPLAEGEGSIRDVLIDAVARNANLRGADLRGADLTGAYLTGADLTGAKLNWQSHDLLSELLRRSAGEDLQRLMLAGLPLVTRDLCWDWYASVLTPEQRAWCAEALAPWARTDNEVPALLRREIERIEAASSEVTL